MHPPKHLPHLILPLALLLSLSPKPAHAYLIPTLDVKASLAACPLVVKVKVVSILETKKAAPVRSDLNGSPEYEATCDVLSAIKGDADKQIKIKFIGDSFSEMPRVEADKTYLVFLRDGDPHDLAAVVRATDAKIEPVFGKTPADLLLAELASLAEGKDTAPRIEALRQLGLLRDIRAAKVLAVAAADSSPALVREAVIAQYRVKIAPDAAKVMRVFDPTVLDVWYQESGDPQKTSQGKSMWRREGGIPILERGLPDFDYATYIREGIKLDWVRKDDKTLYSFFGIPWKVQRKACVPELAKLLDDPDQKVRWWAVLCLTHTVENKDEPQWPQFEPNETKLLDKWHTWWKEKGPAYMIQKSDPE